MNRKILERRLQMLDMSFSGLRCSQWIPTLARDYRVSESAIWSDWGRRETWLPKIIQLDRSALKMSELFARLEKALTRVYSLMLTSPNESVRIGASRTVGSLSKTMFEIGSQAGVYPSLLKEVLEKLNALEEEMKS